MGILSSKLKTFCAFCRTPRNIYKKKSISFVNILGAFLASIVLMYVIWQAYDPRVMIIWVVNIVVAEVFIKMRWRLSVPCPHCGFDPVIYKKDPVVAAELVKTQISRRKVDPKYMLSRSLNLPAISPERAKTIENQGKTGQLLSRSL